MAENKMLGPEGSIPPTSATGMFREQSDDPHFKNDFADLAARFSAMSGGGLSPESSADLALEIVLNEIVEQACLATGASGAAIILERDGQMICRAVSGPTAPELGSKLDMASGLAGECFNTHRTQWCDDASSDLRTDVVASAQMGVRSVVMMPLLRDSKVLGVIELFSGQPYAFGLRDERTLEVLADRTVNNLQHASQPQELKVAQDGATSSPLANLPAITPLPDLPWPEDAHGIHTPDVSENVVHDFVAADFVTAHAAREAKPVVRSRSDTINLLLNASVWVCAILFGLVVGRQWGAKHASQRTRPALTTSVAAAAPVKPAMAAPVKTEATGSSSVVNNVASSTSASASAAATTKMPAPPVAKPSAASAAKTSSKAPAQAAEVQVPPGGLSVFENGREVFRMPPNGAPKTIVDQREIVDKRETETPMKPASSIESESVDLPPDAAEDSLVERVEPEYPEAARQKKIQGTVVLDVRIGADGSVENVQPKSGPPLLAQAATDAVKQWKFQPHMVDGHAVKTRTTTTLSFFLPKQ